MRLHALIGSRPRHRARLTRRAVVELGLFAGIVALLVAIAALAVDGAARRSLRVDVLTARRAEPGETLPVTVSARDARGIPSRVEVDLGDGHRRVINRPTRPCSASQADTELFDLEHAFEKSGIYTVRATVTSTGCGPPERTTGIWTITVKPLRR